MNIDASLLQEAAAQLNAGHVVAFPTETVYGLGVDPQNIDAIHRLFAVKQRPPTQPLALLLADSSEMTQWADPIPPVAWKLAEHFWPGPLTMVLPRAAHVPSELTAGKDTIGLRIPNHPVALALLKTFGRAIATSSANLSGEPSLMTAEQLKGTFGDEIATLLADDTDCGNLASTVLDLTQSPPKILRQGPISHTQLLPFLP